MTLVTLISSILPQSFQPGWRTGGGLFGAIVTNRLGKHRPSGGVEGHTIAVDHEPQGLAEILQKMEAVSDLNCVRRAATSAFGVDAGGRVR
ncbi:hypothetical protein [Sinorhizobium saheli]|uniref:Uncharacterized protein n=1 Tax=Sinorhizobium saheli TaxID=36856 RepID=A0A178XXU5_SINSA|nr:hypothetical protein [Sinorhizobium saheli]MQW86404.1 hypothetical protein [Sinorhizobium saheli]OAP39632.1 hypothetical protein ATB98_04730 [Sinorhizobium saheli]